MNDALNEAAKRRAQALRAREAEATIARVAALVNNHATYVSTASVRVALYGPGSTPGPREVYRPRSRR